MRILITNDDGIHAPGLAVLERIAAKLSDDVIVVAPETDQSGVAHSLSVNDPLRLRTISERRYAVKGTPTDCVIMGVKHILGGEKPDLVLSGVNAGQNIAEDVTYSGTIAGAMEGTILGIPSFALSQAYGKEAYGGTGGREGIRWDCAETHAPGLIKRILAAGFAKDIVINVNFPPCPSEMVEGISATMQGRRDALAVKIEPRLDGRHNVYYWIGFGRQNYEIAPGTDLEALSKNRISVTPLKLDLTDEPTVTRYAQLFES
ncbi:MAG: 5'/3'-nucleotidase SurE [Beijerinckiaceae bacterium]|jgi:5'-nucleotidase